MFSERFQKTIRLTDHARQSMAKRDIDEGLVLEIIETGETNYKDDVHLWIYKHIPQRDDNHAVRGGGRRASHHRENRNDRLEDQGDAKMNIHYYPEDDTLHIELSKDNIVRDESYGWNVNIGYSEKGIAEITILEAKAAGYLPLRIDPAELAELTKAA